MPCLVINNRTSVFATFIDQFATYYDDELNIFLLTDAETVTLQDLESTQKLFETPIIYTDTHHNKHTGMTVGHDGEI